MKFEPFLRKFNLQLKWGFVWSDFRHERPSVSTRRTDLANRSLYCMDLVRGTCKISSFQKVHPKEHGGKLPVDARISREKREVVPCEPLGHSPPSVKG